MTEISIEIADYSKKVISDKLVKNDRAVYSLIFLRQKRKLRING